MIDVPDADVAVNGLAVAEADAAAAAAAAVASSRCPGVAVAVPPADVMMFDADESCSRLLRKLPDA